MDLKHLTHCLSEWTGSSWCSHSLARPLSGAQVYAGLFPLGGEGQEFEAMCAAMDKLLLNDAR